MISPPAPTAWIASPCQSQRVWHPWGTVHVPSALEPVTLSPVPGKKKNYASTSNQIPDLSINSTESTVTAYVLVCCAWSKRTQISRARSLLSTTLKTSGRKIPCERMETSSVAISSGKK